MTWPPSWIRGLSVMIATISQNASSVISVSVGQEIRVRESQKVAEAEKLPRIDKKIADRKESAELQESQVPKQSPEQIKEVITRLENTLKNVEPKIELSVDEELNQVIVRILDKESGELIKQFPPEEVLELDRFFAGQS